jgi:hypothetical protein
MKKILFWVYPFLFAVYPVMALAVYNLIYIDPGSIARSLLFAMALAGLIWVLLRGMVRDWDKAGIITVGALILLFSYGHVYIQLQNSFGEALRHRFLAGIYSLVFAVWVWWVLKKLKNATILQSVLITIGCVLTGFSIIQLAGYELFSNRQAITADTTDVRSNENGNGRIDQGLPDIYWILLDAHTRTDVLKEHFGHDNSAFVEDLEAAGFYVAKCSQSNYPSTRYSVTSLMNANYIDQLPGVTKGIPPLNISLVNQTVRSLGYSVITFKNRSTGHFDLGEDLRLSRNQPVLGMIDLFGGPNEFEFMLMKTSALRLIYDMPQLIPGLDPQVFGKGEFYEHYQQTLFILNTLPKLPQQTQDPKFVFAHILVPHPPYIFSPDGKYGWGGDEITGYRSNVQFIDAQIAKVVKKIVENSEIPPIIIVQGDHGPSTSITTPEMRMPILNAYYVNDETKSELYATITPVNSFRIIFNSYFGTTYPLLEDKSYYAYGEGEFSAENIIPNTCVAP